MGILEQSNQLEKETKEIKLRRAREFALKKHGDQPYGKPPQKVRPYIYHLDMVHEVCKEFGLDVDIQVAAYLHDVLEDTSTGYTELHYEFGAETAALVESVSDAPGKNRKERKKGAYPKIRSNANGTPLKLADRIANVRTCINDDNWSLMGMYVKEQATFEKNLKVRYRSCYDAMWTELSRLIETKNENIKV